MEDSGISIAAVTAQSPATVDGQAPALIPEQLEAKTSGLQSQTSGSSRSSPMSQSIDDFTHLLAPRGMVSSLTSKSQYSQVVFHDVCDIYPTDSDVNCRYTLTSDVTAQPGDKVAIFKVNWTSVSEYVTFERAPQPTDEGTSLTVTFKADRLPKDTKTLYQLCYVTSGNVIAGASTPFSFHVPTESELIGVEDPNDPGMVVFRSRVAKLQDDILKKNEDYDQLLLKHSILEENMQVLKKELDKADAQVESSKKAYVDTFTQKQSLEIDNKVLQERLTQFQLETGAVAQLEEELNKLKAEKESLELEVKSVNAEYNKLKQEFDDTKEKDKRNFMALKMENLDLSANLAKHFERVQETAQQLESQNSTIECLRQDCERTSQALREQVRTVELLTSLNEDLNQKMTQLTSERDNLLEANDLLECDSNVLQKTISRLGEEVESLKRFIQETYDSDDKAKVHALRAQRLEEEKEMLQAQLANLEEHHNKCDRKINSLASQLKDLSLHGGKTEEPPRRRSHDSDPAGGIFEVVRTVASNLLPSVKTSYPKAPSRPSSSSYSEASSPTDEKIESVKIKLQETRQLKADLSSELVSVRHTLSEKDRALTELKQDNAFKKNRIDVLELELRAAKVELAKLKECAQSEVGVPNTSLNVISKFNENVAVLSQLNAKLEMEQAEKTQLQSKVMDLLAKDAEMCAQLQSVKDRYAQVCKQVQIYKKTNEAETFEELTRALDDCDMRRKVAEKKVTELTENKARLEKQVATLRAESVGKISVDCSRKMQEHINTLELQLSEMTKFSNYMKHFIYHRFSDGLNKPLTCPLCPTMYPASSDEHFAKHFKAAHMKLPADPSV